MRSSLRGLAVTNYEIKSEGGWQLLIMRSSLRGLAVTNYEIKSEGVGSY